MGKGSDVAVVELHGGIGSQINATVYSRILENIARDNSYGGLLLDIDSPGGSATASEVLHRSIERVADVKPVMSYIRGMGASGGYYLCCASNYIFAMPTAMVGSVGVIYLRPILEQLLGRTGIEFSVYKSGQFKDMGGFWRGPTTEESSRLQSLINEVYDNFVQVVVKGRMMEEDKVREVATGELMTGKRALELGLIDRLGDYTDALNAVAKLADIKPRTKIVSPRRPWLQRMLGRPRAELSVLSGLSSSVQMLMGGGVYYMSPAHLLGYPVQE